VARGPTPARWIFYSVLLRYGEALPSSAGQLDSVLAPLTCPTLTGWSIALYRQASDKLPLVQRLRPRYVCHANPFCNDGPHRPIVPCGLLRARERNWWESPDRTKSSRPAHNLRGTWVTHRFLAKYACRALLPLTPSWVPLSSRHVSPVFWGLYLTAINTSHHPHPTSTLFPYPAYRYISAIESRAPWT